MLLYRIGLFLSLALVSLLVYKVINLLRYIAQARRTGLPWVFTWILETENVGFILTLILRWKYQEFLLQGKGWPRWCRLMIRDWSFEDKRRAHDEYGDVFLAVSPEGIICYACDAAMSWDVMNRRNEFIKPRDRYKLLEIHGPNVLTTEAKAFRFHLRIVAPPFADGAGANELVWNETKLQTRRLIAAWHKQTQISSSLQLDINGLSLAVIAKAGFGHELEWTEDLGASVNIIPPGYTLSFLEAITTTVFNIVPVLLLPRWLMYMSPLRQAAIAHDEFERYVRQMIREEKRKIDESRCYESASTRSNLLTSVLRASANEATKGTKSEDGISKKQAFTETEVMGNLFIFLLAGYETTANAILYGLICLALYPEIQDRIIEEVDSVYAQAAEQGRSELTYADDFEKFIYTYGFMYETLRLFPGPQQIIKTFSQPTDIHLSTPHGSRAVLLPAECCVYLNVMATHYAEHYWPDPYKLDPTRWLHERASRTNKPSPEQATRPRFVEKKRYEQGTFLTFSDGGRPCLGKKFAQSEYVSFVTTLLGEFRVKLAEKEDRKDVERKIFCRCKGTLTLTPLDQIGLVVERREGRMGKSEHE